MIPYGPYYLVKRLAVGGMAEVFLATERERADGSLLVVKRILPHLQAKPDFLQMFLDEARLTEQLRHPNVVRVVNFGEADGVHFIAMEYIDGMSISGVQRSLGPKGLEVNLSCWIISEACKGLAYAHETTDENGEPLSIVHRDISPDNILLSQRGEVKLADFGVAKATLQLTRTRPGQIKGKLAYMSPEQGMRLKVDHRSDIFSAGLVLYELTTGKRVFDAPNEVGVLRALYQREYKAPQEVVENYPRWLAEIVNKALMWDPDGRYQKAAEMREALLQWISKDLSKELSEIITRLCKVKRGPLEHKTEEETAPVPAPTTAPLSVGGGETQLGIGEVQRILAEHAAGEADGRVTQEVPEMANATIEEPVPALEIEGDHRDTLRDYRFLKDSTPLRIVEGEIVEPGGVGNDTEPMPAHPELFPPDSGSTPAQEGADFEEAGGVDDYEEGMVVVNLSAVKAPEATARIGKDSSPEDAFSDSGFQPVSSRKVATTYEIFFNKKERIKEAASKIKEVARGPWLFVVVATVVVLLVVVLVLALS